MTGENPGQPGQPEGYEILATQPDDRVHVMKDGDAFAIFDRRGDIFPIGASTQGLYFSDTRVLSRFALTIEGQRPLLLSSSVSSGGALLVVDMTNGDITRGGAIAIPHGALHVCRTMLMRDGVLRQRLRVTNFDAHEVDIHVSLDVDADFADVFEVRGHRRSKRGTRHPAEIAHGALALGYTGLDGIERRVRISTSPACDITGSRVSFRLRLKPRVSKTAYITVRNEGAIPRKRRAGAAMLQDACKISSSSSGFDLWLNRSRDDLRMMLTTTRHGPYPYAGVPWFSTVFGRDGIITALETLWVDASISKGVLSFLAATQATETNEDRACEPGKILHELRAGEMANVGEVPFGRYYGSVDATPLFVMLAGEYLKTTGDQELIKTIWPNIKAAIGWMDGPGDVDGDGFLEYRGSPKGLVQQGWKDSSDSVFHDDGTAAAGPIALSEVQAYAFAARRAAAMIAQLFGEDDFATLQERKALALKAQFESAFWAEDIGTFGLALDGNKRLCRVRTSNAGHCLWAGIAQAKHAAGVAATLLDDRSFTGWGVRTVAAAQQGFNPMSYHNGSIWPHDNAIIAAGLAKYGHKREAVRILAAMLEVTRQMELSRLPELFCGFARAHGKGPTLYPVACSPQAWASGAVYMMLQACLGMSIDAAHKRIIFDHPQLPVALRELEIHGLRVGADASVDIVLHRYHDGVGLDVRARRGNVDVIMLK